MDRRGFLQGILALGIAPAIVRASSLMPIAVLEEPLIILPSGVSAGNQIITLSMITAEALRILEQNLILTKSVNRIWDWKLCPSTVK